MLDAQKKTLRCIVPKDPIIGVPAGTDPNSLLESPQRQNPVGRGGAGSPRDVEMDGDGYDDGDGEDTEEETRDMDQSSSGDMDDVVGELEDSDEGGDMSAHFV